MTDEPISECGNDTCGHWGEKEANGDEEEGNNGDDKVWKAWKRELKEFAKWLSLSDRQFMASVYRRASINNITSFSTRNDFWQVNLNFSILM